MRIAVLGAGVIGTTTAYYLAKAGHEVTVYDRQSGPALETSFANAGEISPGYSTPWAAPGIPLKAIKWLFMRHAPLIVRPTLDPHVLPWMLSLLMNCTSAAYARNKGRMLRIAGYSRECLIALRQETGIAYDHRSQGTVQLFRTQKQLDHAGRDTEVLSADGVPFELLDRDGVAGAEPALAATKESFVGGLRLPLDETGDCYLFTDALAKIAGELGVRFRYGVSISGIETEGGAVSGVATSEGRIDADHYVLALGSWSPVLGRTIGLRLPVYPVKGYSLTAGITDETRAPVSTVLDETYKVALTRLGSRLRVGGMAEIGGYNTDLPPIRRGTLEHVAGSLFPCGDLKAASYWSGLRPMTPDGTPIIGATRYRNLSLNTGHGTLGWTMACGSARALADLISGRKPDIETADLSIDRY
ncbi:D-amino acid dehydrogenase [Pleomorphomonas carboxyditropha]|uniref:D-amino acid dehydrogenase n=1 Tax=Pleomorphomonas carboxyditropha TaxID=2023338 RepID=A0A2G9WVA1_9HYPH|nr:D-amino acid dehydrogenase [Pleomorphomonas carboxyditropha]PIO98638.1 D-amino acid dehydrogenase small subunit [Pleomorphomonas carboxyditropha]